MTAKEFYEQNKGKYFYYEGEKVRVVGYRKDFPTKYLIITYSDGWTNEEDYNVIDPSLIDSESLVNGEWRFYYVIEKQLNSLEPKNIDLCEILKGCEGVELWSDIFGKCKLLDTKGDCSYKIEVQVIDKNDDENGFECFTTDGRFYEVYPNGKCMLWPSETNRDWSTFEKPIKIKEGDPVMTKWNSAAFWKLENYTKDNKSDFIVPVSDFDFTDFDSNKSKSIK